ncbi:hypothetical protein BYT27DRAFT_7196076 [Phlegmacium glaucopus]|nr:hypothetical protein BYT27DRAFT_7196076 [Phlegmacium glaucopus]
MGTTNINAGAIKAPPRAPARVACKTSIPPRSTWLWRRTAHPKVPESIQNSIDAHNRKKKVIMPSVRGLLHVIERHSTIDPMIRPDIKPPTAPM